MELEFWQFLVVFVVGLAGVPALVFGIVFAGRRRHRRLVRTCAGETTGIVDRSVTRWVDEGPTLVWVRYEVGGVTHELRETVKYRLEGRTKCPKVPVAAGSEVRVRYDPADPSRAVLPDNDGIITG